MPRPRARYRTDAEWGGEDGESESNESYVSSRNKREKLVVIGPHRSRRLRDERFREMVKHVMHRSCISVQVLGAEWDTKCLDVMSVLNGRTMANEYLKL